MTGEAIMGVPIEEVRRQMAASPGYDVDPQSKMEPLWKGTTLEPCIEGGEKILKDPKLKEMFRRIYRR